MKHKIRPVFRLTLKRDAVAVIYRATVEKKKPFAYVTLAHREAGGVDVGITFSMAEQLMTYAKPGENLSDAVVRLLSN